MFSQYSARVSTELEIRYGVVVARRKRPAAAVVLLMRHQLFHIPVELRAGMSICNPCFQKESSNASKLLFRNRVWFCRLRNPVESEDVEVLRSFYEVAAMGINVTPLGTLYSTAAQWSRINFYRDTDGRR